MGSANFHQHHHLQDQHLHLLDSSPPPNSSSYGVSNWPQPHHPTSLSTRDSFNPNNNNIDGAIINSRQDSNTPNMAQNMGFQWTHCTNTTAGVTFTGSGRNQSPHDLQLERIKDEFSAETYPKFTEMISSSPTSSIEDLHLHPSSSYIKNHQQQQQQREFNGLNQLPSGGDFMFYSSNSNNNSHRGTFSQIFPTVNISNLNHHSSSASSLDMNLPALDLFSGSLIQPSSIDHNPQFGGIFKDTTTFSSYGSTLDHMQQVGQRPTNKISAAFNSGGGGGGGTEAKRPACNFMDTTKAPPQAAPPKKSRLESRASCPPFKVRKENLGDRIAALQQLVAPFGKTDTASVLMEAIGYIKFLQNQVETLSVPYMKSNKTSRTMRGGSMEDGKDQEQKRDLRSRGLCLVPLPCLSYVTDGGGGVWPPPNFTRAT